MLSFFPTPYPDELLYSLIARYQVRSGNTSPKATLEDLFDSRTGSAIVDMPCNIDLLKSKLPPYMKLESENIILQHTMFPFYTAFLSHERVSVVMESMKEDYGGDIHTRTGIMASSIQVSQYLQYCHECNKEDLIKYG